MILLNIFNHLAGAVKIRINGSIPEKFINLCLAQHIFLWGIKKEGSDMYAWLRLPDFFRIRGIVRLSDTQVEVVRFFGVPFIIKKMKRRKMMVIGAVLCFVTLNILSSYIWFIDITGVKTISADRVRIVAFHQGLKPGIPKNALDTKQLEKNMLLNIPEAAWVGVTFTGTRAIIEVVEKTVPKPEDKRPAHIVADKDGVVTEIIVLAGQPAVKKGDTIKKGDLLIKGFAAETASPASPSGTQVITIPTQLIRANGIVRAQIWYESYGEANLVKTLHRRTGHKQMAVTVIIGDRQYLLKQVGEQPYPHFETESVHKKMPLWRNSLFTVESKIDIYHELEVSYLEIALEEARDQAKNTALQAVQDRIPENAQILSRNIEVMKTQEPNLVRVKVNIETVEDIGRFMNIQ